MSSNIYIIGGPTASGKSDYAIKLAQKINGEIINGDSMQLYSHLHILTARPTDTQGIPHHLYGVLIGNQTSSVGWWYEKASEVIEDVLKRGKVPIVVGGTGLYLRALTHGLSPVPSIPTAIRQECRQLAQELTEEEFYDLVTQEDPMIRGVLHQNDTQRLTRALEVIRATHQSLLETQGKAQKIVNLNCNYFVLLPPREVLYERINNRFFWMVENGALREVEQLLAQNINPELPIFKAVGVPEITSYLKGDLSLKEAIKLGQQSTRQYAKRQITWFTRQVSEAQIVTHDLKS
ncbi:MAG: tRNA (adenosine(37)-N6)-dimethylallyltransferase MiaA [Alphaproteobacteria bacterium]|nr:tRNA (adenosine(37)-N6)-dimethylallyltransferase MiaA [Alphaproteobacteria bacterium]